jgi:hypothetical protein
MDTVSNKIVNFDKLHEITQGADENPALFLNCLQEAPTPYTQLDPTSPAGAAILAGHFISQSTPDIRAKLKKAKDGPQTSIQDLMKMACKVLMPEKRQQNQPTKNTSNKRWPSKPKPWWQPCSQLDYSPVSKEELETSHQPLWGPTSNVARKATGLASAST